MIFNMLYARVNKLQFASQIPSIACLFVAYELRKYFTLLNGLKIFMIELYNSNYINQISLSISKVLLETVMSIHLHTVYDCFCTTIARMSSCNRDHTTSKVKIFTILSVRESLSSPALWQHIFYI